MSSQKLTFGKQKMFYSIWTLLTSLLLSCRSSVNLQDPFADGGDPAFPRRNAMTPNSQGYQPGMAGPPEMMGRMGPYESNKDPFGGMRKGKCKPTRAHAVGILLELKLMLHIFIFIFYLKPESSSCHRALTVGWENSTTEARLAPWAICRWARGNSTRTDTTAGKHYFIPYVSAAAYDFVIFRILSVVLLSARQL